MNIEDYPIFTIIMRGYTLKQADIIVEAMTGFEKYFGVEVTLNTDHAYEIIQHLSRKYGHKVKIGAGTVRTLQEAKQAAAAGAAFLLGPHFFTEEMIGYCKKENILSIPSGVTPSEIEELFRMGADIVKVFPAAVVGPRFFKDIQAPMGKMPLMAVGGISKGNVRDFLSNGASFAGLGSSLFSEEMLVNPETEKIKDVYRKFIRLIN